jgi:hypothetical protein
MYWRLISRVRRQVGRKQTPKEIRELIFQMVAENPAKEFNYVGMSDSTLFIMDKGAVLRNAREYQSPPW